MFHLLADKHVQHQVDDVLCQITLNVNFANMRVISLGCNSVWRSLVRLFLDDKLVQHKFSGDVLSDKFERLSCEMQIGLYFLVNMLQS